MKPVFKKPKSAFRKPTKMPSGFGLYNKNSKKKDNPYLEICLRATQVCRVSGKRSPACIAANIRCEAAKKQNKEMKSRSSTSGVKPVTPASPEKPVTPKGGK